MFVSSFLCALSEFELRKFLIFSNFAIAQDLLNHHSLTREDSLLRGASKCSLYSKSKHLSMRRFDNPAQDVINFFVIIFLDFSKIHFGLKF